MSDQTSKILLKIGGSSRELVQRLKRLQEIGVALSAEQDLEKLLAMILREARRITNADSGSIYVREDERSPVPEATAKDDLYRATPYLVLRVAQNDSVEFPFKQIRLPFDAKSVAGYVALTGHTVNVEDVYEPPAGMPFQISNAFDKATGYRSRSMLVLPMHNRKGDVIGVLQLINRKKAAERIVGEEAARRWIEPFDEIDEELLASFASQAAVCIEKSRLYEAIERMFEGLVKSFSNALEHRNQATAGHCERVAMYAEAIARAVNEATAGPFKELRFTPQQIRQLRYAALLHDIGKIAVREAVLDKRNKLTDAEIKAVEYRLALSCQQRIAAGEDAAKVRAEVESDVAFLRRINIPRGMTPEDQARLRELAKKEFTDLDGERKPVLTPWEVENLEIARGNLTAAERKEIEGHSKGSWEILKEIPWPEELARIPNIAASHHEKIDGSGYPWGLKASDVSIEGRILAIVDIFEALTAADRPYKPAIPVPKALAIVESEVKAGKLDADLFRLFVEKKGHALFMDEAGYIRRRKAEEMT